jgi:hypothetical protein
VQSSCCSVEDWFVLSFTVTLRQYFFDKMIFDKMMIFVKVFCDSKGHTWKQRRATSIDNGSLGHVKRVRIGPDRAGNTIVAIPHSKYLDRTVLLTSLALSCLLSSTIRTRLSPFPASIRPSSLSSCLRFLSLLDCSCPCSVECTSLACCVSVIAAPHPFRLEHPLLNVNLQCGPSMGQ